MKKILNAKIATKENLKNEEKIIKIISLIIFL